jgi:hypothetical protein
VKSTRCAIVPRKRSTPVSDSIRRVVRPSGQLVVVGDAVVTAERVLGKDLAVAEVRLHRIEQRELTLVAERRVDVEQARLERLRVVHAKQLAHARRVTLERHARIQADGRNGAIERIRRAGGVGAGIHVVLRRVEDDLRRHVPARVDDRVADRRLDECAIAFGLLEAGTGQRDAEPRVVGFERNIETVEVIAVYFAFNCGSRS